MGIATVTVASVLTISAVAIVRLGSVVRLLFVDYGFRGRAIDICVELIGANVAQCPTGTELQRTPDLGARGWRPSPVESFATRVSTRGEGTHCRASDRWLGGPIAAQGGVDVFRAGGWREIRVGLRDETRVAPQAARSRHDEFS